MNPRKIGVLVLAWLALVLGALAQNVSITNFTWLANDLVQCQAGGGTPGMVLSFQTSPDLVNWRTLDFTNSADGTATFADYYVAPTNGTGRFYRVRQDAPVTTVTVTNYHGWTNCLILQNSVAEVDIVPTVGRIMQFRFLGATNGPFWENTTMEGQQPSASQWNSGGAFGGDKVWPSPQSWPWPPPRAYDSLPFTGTVSNGVVILTGPADTTSFGTRVVRYITLHPTEAIMHVTSLFQKLSGGTVTNGVWSITQSQYAQAVYLPVPQKSGFTNGYIATGGFAAPSTLSISNGLLSFTPNGQSKVGNDGGSVLWVQTNSVLLIESPRVPGVAKTGYPDTGCSVEAYVNTGPNYIELEILAPLVGLSTNLNPVAAANTVYSLLPRTQSTPAGEAMKYLVR